MKPFIYTEDNSTGFSDGTLVNVQNNSLNRLVLVGSNTSGTRTTSSLELTMSQASNSIIDWVATTPIGTSVSVEASMSFDNGVSWTAWKSVQKGGRIQDIVYFIPPSEEGTDLSAGMVRFRQTLTTATAGISPSLNLFSAIIDPRSSRGEIMMRYLPDFYQEARVVGALMHAQGVEFDTIYEELDDVLNQFFVRTSTWGIDRWEEFVGLAPDTSRTLTERQDRVVARLRGYGTATIGVVSQVAQAYTNGEIAIIEDYEHYQVIFKFIGSSGIPSNINDFYDALRAVVPAHLLINLEYTFTTWDWWDAQAYTWNATDALGLTFNQSDILV